MSDDPFKPADDKTETKPSEAVASPADDPQNYYSVEFTLKAHSSYDGEWIKPKVFGPTAEETASKAKALLEQMRDQGVFELVAGAAKFTRDNYQPAQQSRPNNNGGGQQQKRQYKTQDAPGGGKTCEHGQMNYREGTSKKGKPYKAYFCPQDQCSAEWV